MKVVERRRFFLLDDDNDEAEIYNEIINESKLLIELHYFNKGAQMFDYLQKTAPDVFIIDINLPGISGLEWVRRLKADERYKNIPIIVCTSVSTPGKPEESISAGAFRFVLKPYDYSGYKSLLHELYSLCRKKDSYIFGKTG